MPEGKTDDDLLLLLEIRDRKKASESKKRVFRTDDASLWKREGSLKA